MGGALSVLGAPKKVASRKKFAKKNGSKQELVRGRQIGQRGRKISAQGQRYTTVFSVFIFVNLDFLN